MPAELFPSLWVGNMCKPEEIRLGIQILDVVPVSIESLCRSISALVVEIEQLLVAGEKRIIGVCFLAIEVDLSGLVEEFGHYGRPPLGGKASTGKQDEFIALLEHSTSASKTLPGHEKARPVARPCRSDIACLADCELDGIRTRHLKVGGLV